MTNIKQLPFLKPGTSLVLSGDTGHGKTSLAVELMHHLWKTEQKKTVVFLADAGGSGWAYDEELDPAIEQIIRPSGNSWLWVLDALQNKAAGKPAWSDQTGLIIHEGLTTYGQMVLNECATQAGRGVNIGGGGAMDVSLYPAEVETRVSPDGKLLPVKPKDKDQAVVIGSNNIAHYGVTQDALRTGLMGSRGPVPTLFTALESVAKAKGGMDAAVGPGTVGEAQVRDIPKWMTYTFRIHQSTDNAGQPRTTLYTTPHSPALRTQAYSNARVPAGGAGAKVKPTYTPASLVAVLTDLRARRQAAYEELIQS